MAVKINRDLRMGKIQDLSKEEIEILNDKFKSMSELKTIILEKHEGSGESVSDGSDNDTGVESQTVTPEEYYTYDAKDIPEIPFIANFPDYGKFVINGYNEETKAYSGVGSDSDGSLTQCLLTDGIAQYGPVNADSTNELDNLQNYYVCDSNLPLNLVGTADRPTYNGNDLALTADNYFNFVIRNKTDGASLLFSNYDLLSYNELLKLKLDFSSVTRLNDLFKNCTKLTNIPEYDTSDVTSMSGTFSNCQSLTTIPLLNTSNVTNMLQMFYNCQLLKTIPALNTSKVTTMSGMFENCYKLTSIPYINTWRVTDMSSMFSSCNSLKTIPNLDTSACTSMDAMFYGCNSLETIPQLVTSKVSSMGSMFMNCTSLTTIPLLNTSAVTFMKQMFYGCTSLTSVPELTTTRVTNMTGMFYGCTSLTSIPSFNVNKVSDFTNIFYGCHRLSEIHMTNIVSNLDISPTALEHDAIVEVISNLSKTNYTRKLTMGSDKLALLSDDEKAVATNKGWKLA